MSEESLDPRELALTIEHRRAEFYRKALDRVASARTMRQARAHAVSALATKVGDMPKEAP